MYVCILKVIGATDVISHVLNPGDCADVSVQSIVSDIITHFVGTGNLKVESRQPDIEIFKFSEALSNIDVSSDCVFLSIVLCRHTVIFHTAINTMCYTTPCYTEHFLHYGAELSINYISGHTLDHHALCYLM